MQIHGCERSNTATQLAVVTLLPRHKYGAAKHNRQYFMSHGPYLLNQGSYSGRFQANLGENHFFFKVQYFHVSIELSEHTQNFEWKVLVST